MDSKRCITFDEVSGTNDSKSHVGVRRCRDTEVTRSDSGKRRKFHSVLHENVVQQEIQCSSAADGNSPEVVVSSAEFGNCDHVSSSSCFRNCLSLDLKVELCFETDPSMSGNGGFSRETTSSSDICLDSDKMESSSTMKNKPVSPPAVTSDRNPPSTSAKISMAAEIEEFFAVAEMKEQKRFSDKYNFDFVNDVPIKGRYQWVGLKP